MAITKFIPLSCSGTRASYYRFLDDVVFSKQMLHRRWPGPSTQFAVRLD